MKEYMPRIIISGETAGTGGSTTSKILSDALGIPNISGGKYFRGLANRFNKYTIDNRHIATAQNYLDFLLLYENAYNQDGLNGVNHLVGDGFVEGAKGDILAQFGQAIESKFERTNKIDKVWDYAVEQNTILEALSNPGFVWEAKIAILALELDQMQNILPQNEFINTLYLKVLLSIDPKIAAERVGFRENRTVPASEITKRRDRDFARYGKLYTIKNIPIEHGDLSKHADIKIDTQNTEQDGVANRAMQSYIQKLNTLSTELPEVTTSIISKLASIIPPINTQ